MGDEYKKNLKLGDKAICSSTLRRFINRANNARDQQMHNVNDNVIHDLPEQENIPQINNSFAIEPDSAVQDLDIFNFIKNFLVEECHENLFQKGRPTNLKELIQSDGFFEIIKTNISKSPGELLYMIMNYSIDNSLSMTAMVNLFKFVNNIFTEPVLPDSKYFIDKLMNPQNNIEFHAVCHNCNSYIGNFEEVKTIKTCSTCQFAVDLSKMCSSSYFVIIDPSQAISDLLHIYENYYDNIVNNRFNRDASINDIYHGKIYYEFVDSLPEEEKKSYVTTIFNTDGAPKFKSSQFSIWPLYLMINELPIQDRLKNILCCGLWINRHTPDISVFLDPFVEKINKLSSVGIRCMINNQERKIKLFVLVCCVDSVARPKIQGIKQFNGFYGCNWCEHPGIHKFGSMRYPVTEETPNLREDTTTVNHMLNIDRNNPIVGIKFPSPFINLEKFKIIQGFVPDYMHCVLEEVGKQFTNQYLLAMTADEILVLDNILQQIKFPCQVARLTRPLSVRNDWSAREWENFILFSSVPLFKLILSKNYVDHWILLVNSLYILLQDRIALDELDTVEEMLQSFVQQAQSMFSIKMLTFNVHLLLHLTQSIRNWGPLWAISTYPFESENRNLLRAIRCARGATQQIVRFVNINHSLIVLREHIHPHINDSAQWFCDHILSSKVQNTLKISDITYFGKGEDVNGDEEFLHLPGLSCTSTKVYQKMVKSGCLYDTKDNERSNNSFAILDNGKIVRLKKFIVDVEPNKEYTLCDDIETTDFDNCYKKLQKIVDISQNSFAIDTIYINRVCVIIKIDDDEYLCPIPNLIKY